VGDYAEVKKAFSESDVKNFASICGDHNPVHVDPACPDPRFPKRIVHGILTASLFSNIFGSHIPGSIYINQSLNFRAPVFLDDMLTARITVLSMRKKLVTCSTTVHNEQGQIVIDGQAVVHINTLVQESSITAPEDGGSHKATSAT